MSEAERTDHKFRTGQFVRVFVDARDGKPGYLDPEPFKITGFEGDTAILRRSDIRGDQVAHVSALRAA